MKSTNAKFIDKTVTLRQYHEDSTQAELRKGNIKPLRLFLTVWLTYQDVRKTASPIIRKALLYKCIRILFDEKKFVAGNQISFSLAVLREFKGYSIHYILMIGSRFYFDKGYSFRQTLKMKSGMK